MQLCQYKKIYKTYSEALNVTRRIQKRKKGRYSKQEQCVIYRCRECGFWHLSHAVNIYHENKDKKRKKILCDGHPKNVRNMP